MFRIEGNGCWNHTKVWKDEEQLDWSYCIITINKNGCSACVDNILGKLDRVVLIGVYKLIGDGEFNNTNIIVGDQVLRGVQSVVLRIEKDKDPICGITFVFLPNIVEGEDNEL